MKIIFRFAVVAALFVLLAAEPTRLTEAAPVHINNATDVATESSKQPPLTSEQVEKPVEQPKPAPTPVPKPQVTGTKYDWLRQAGVPESDWQYADYIVSREASWNPNALNKSSGACSLAQALPCSKIKGDWRDPIVALKWQYQYVTSRYGSYYQAYQFWKVNHWY
jgi:hypothetical protein